MDNEKQKILSWDIYLQCICNLDKYILVLLPFILNILIKMNVQRHNPESIFVLFSVRFINLAGVQVKLIVYIRNNWFPQNLNVSGIYKHLITK